MASGLIGLHFVHLLMVEGSFIFSPKHWPCLHFQSTIQLVELQWEVSLRVTGTSSELVIGFHSSCWVEEEFVVFSGTFQGQG